MPGRPKGPSPAEQVMDLKLENRELKTKLNEAKEKLSALRKAARAEARVVKGSTVHVKIPGISKANLHDVPNIDDLLKEINRLEQVVAALEALLETTKVELASEQAANGRLTEHVASLEQMVGELRADLRLKARQLEAAVAHAAKADAQAKQSAVEAARSAAEAKQYKEAAAEADKLVLAKSKALLEMGAINNALQQQLKEGAAARAVLQADLDTSNEENERLRRAIGAGGMLAKMAKDKEAEQVKMIAEAAEEISLLERKIKLLNRLATGGGGRAP